MILDGLRTGGLVLDVALRRSMVGHLSIGGLVSPTTFPMVDVHAIRQTHGAARVWVADMRAAAVLLTDNDLERATAMLAPGEPFARPIAVVASHDQWELWDRHRYRGKRYGFIRVCFGELQPALEWADRLSLALAQGVDLPGLPLKSTSPARETATPGASDLRCG